MCVPGGNDVRWLPERLRLGHGRAPSSTDRGNLRARLQISRPNSQELAYLSLIRYAPHNSFGGELGWAGEPISRERLSIRVGIFPKSVWPSCMPKLRSAR